MESKTTTINEIEFYRCIYESPRDISGILNKHCSEVEPTLGSEIPDTPTHKMHRLYYTYFKATFTLKQTTCGENFRLISNLPVNKATGLDNKSMRLLKEAPPIVASPLTFIIFQKSLDFSQMSGSLLEFPQSLRMVLKLILITTGQSQFYLLSIN